MKNELNSEKKPLNNEQRKRLCKIYGAQIDRAITNRKEKNGEEIINLKKTVINETMANKEVKAMFKAIETAQALYANKVEKILEK